MSTLSQSRLKEYLYFYVRLSVQTKDVSHHKSEHFKSVPKSLIYIYEDNFLLHLSAHFECQCS